MLDLENFPRRKHFDFYKDMANPYVGMTAEVEITEFLADCRAKKLPFFLTFLHLVGQTANSVKELRYRIVNGGIAEYFNCKTSHSVMCEDETFAFCDMDCSLPLEDFLPIAIEAENQARLTHKLDDGDDPDNLFFVTCIPWVSFTDFLHPTPSPADSNPRIAWGKYFERDGKILLPVSLWAHHALVDGLHFGRFYEELQKRLKNVSNSDTM